LEKSISIKDGRKGLGFHLMIVFTLKEEKLNCSKIVEEMGKKRD